jgi:hypothetical protein
MLPILQNSSTKLQQLIYNQVILTSFKETVGIEIFDRSTILSELYTSRDMIPMHIIYFTGLFLVVYSQRSRLLGFEKEKGVKYTYLLEDGVRIQRTVRGLLLVILFLFSKNVENAI